MQFCPSCGEYSVDFDSYRMELLCHSDGCSCIVHVDGYSVLAKPGSGDPSRIFTPKTIESS
jgi:hypothetical protein